MRKGFDWAAYLRGFHDTTPGVTEAVLSRTLAGGHTPYRWLARAVSPRAQLIVDLACGSGAMSRELALPGRTVLGVDLAESELRLASERSEGPWLCADGLALPLADARRIANGERLDGDDYAKLSITGRDLVQELLHHGHYALEVPDAGT